VLKSISGDAGEGHVCGGQRLNERDVLHLSFLYPYSNQVLANGRGCWTA